VVAIDQRACCSTRREEMARPRRHASLPRLCPRWETRSRSAPARRVRRCRVSLPHLYPGGGDRRPSASGSETAMRRRRSKLSAASPSDRLPSLPRAPADGVKIDCEKGVSGRFRSNPYRRRSARRGPRRRRGRGTSTLTR
jgi:hypothetical protein